MHAIFDFDVKIRNDSAKCHHCYKENTFCQSICGDIRMIIPNVNKNIPLQYNFNLAFVGRFKRKYYLCDMKQEESLRYEEWLTTIANTRLLFNTLSELEDYLDNHSIHSNPIRRCFSSPEKLRAAFRDLKEEAHLMTENELLLDDVLKDYKKAWTYFRAHLSRRSNPQEIATDLLRYCYPPYIEEGISNSRKIIFDEILINNIDVAFIFLMLLKVIPGYDSKVGDTSEVASQYEMVMTMLEEFTKDGSFFDSLPAIIQAREESHKSRFTLLNHVKRILCKYASHVDSENLYDTSSSLKQQYVDIDLEGYWNECGGTLENTRFWQLQAVDTGTYFATHWRKEGNRLIGVRYSFFLLDDDDSMLTLFILHPEAIKHRIQGKDNVDSDYVWYKTSMPTESSPIRLLFLRKMASNSWQPRLELTKALDAKVTNTYDSWLKKCEVVNEFADLHYVFTPNLYAVTPEHLYIPTGNEVEYYKVPRSAHEGFSQVQLGDGVGTLVMNGKTYLAFDELLLYIPATKSNLAKYGIEIVNCIV